MQGLKIERYHEGGLLEYLILLPFVTLKALLFDYE